MLRIFLCLPRVVSHFLTRANAQLENHRFLKGKYHANLLSFQNPKMFACQQKQKKKNVKFIINCHPSAIQLSISASGHAETE